MSMQEDPQSVPPSPQDDSDLLVPYETYTTNGVEIGTQQKSASMRKFIERIRHDGLYVLNLRETDQRIRVAAKFLSRFPPGKILAVSQRQYGQKPVRMFANVTGATSTSERMVPGSLTNPNLPGYVEPKVLVVADPATDLQALTEAVSIGIPVVGLCDVNNETRNVDLVIPANNKGRASLATVYWLLAREVLREQKRLDTEHPFNFSIEDFQAPL